MKILKAALALVLFLAPQAVPQEPATFSTSSSLVVVNVSVRDRSGNLIPNLKKEDFVLSEDDKAQNISVFELQRLTSDVLPAITDKPGTVRQKIALSNDLTPARYRDRRLLALFFDLSSMAPAEQIRATAAAEKFLKTQMTSSDLVSIMTFTTRFRVIEDFTDDRDLLLGTIKKFRIGESSELAVDGATGQDADDDSGMFTADETEFNIFNTDRKLSALEEAARKLSVFPEKKALVYFSSGISKTGVDNQAQLRSTVNAAVRANVAFYPIDARGLVPLVPGGDATAGPPTRTGIFSGKTQQGVKSKFNDQQETLYTLAADTGGKALLDSNDLGLGIKSAQQDINSYYILGYYSTNSAQDGKFRKLKVRIASQPSAKLDYRAGYYASKVFTSFNSGDKERQLEEALTLGDPVSEIPLAVEVDYFRLDKGKYFVPISVKIPGSSIGLKKKGTKQTATLDFIGQVRDKSGHLATGVRDAITVKLDEGSAAQLEKRGVQYDTALTLTPGDYTLKFLARENESGKMGTFESKFTIPDLGALKSMRMSSVIWANQREPLAAAIGSAGTDKKAVAIHPLIQEGQKLAPSITRVFRKNQNLYVYFEVYDAAGISADLALFSGGKKAFESSPVRLTPDSSRSNVVPVKFQLPLAKLEGGAYTAQVNIIDEAGKKFAFPRTAMVLLQ